MRIAFFVNSIEDEFPHYTTTVLAFAALSRGHEICYITPGDFVLRPDDSLMVSALELPNSAYKKLETLHKDLQGDKTKADHDRCSQDRHHISSQRSVPGRRGAPLGSACRRHVRPPRRRTRRISTQ